MRTDLTPYLLGEKSKLPVDHCVGTINIIKEYWNALLITHYEEKKYQYKVHLRRELDRVRLYLDKAKTPRKEALKQN